MHMAKDKRPATAETAGGHSRRDFLKGGMAAAAVGGVGLGAMYFGYDRALAAPVRVGVIGTGDEGCVLIGAVNPDYVNVTAIADIRPFNVHRAFHGDEESPAANAARPGLMKKYGWKTESEARKHVKVYTNGYEEMLDDPNVEGVIIALPLHLHAEASIKAMQKGKHVLCEKLMAHTVGQCKDMGRVAQQTGKVLAVGHQRHYSVVYDNAADQIRRGLIGDVHHIRAQWHRGNLPGRDSWQQPLPNEAMANELASLDKRIDDVMNDEKKWNPAGFGTRDAVHARRRLRALRYLDANVDAAKYGYLGGRLEGPDGSVYEYSPMEELIRWRLFNRTGGGLMAELGSHQLDAASIFISCLHGDGKQKVNPLSVVAVGGRHIFPLDRDADDHVYCMFEFPAPGYEEDPNKKIVVTYSSINGNGFGGYGETVMGANGTLTVMQEKEALYYPPSGAARTSMSAAKSGGPTLDTTQSGGVVEAQKASADSGPVSRGYTEEIEHWAWCIRTGNQPRCNAQVALADAVMALVANQSMAEGRRIEFDPAWFDISKNETPEGAKPEYEVKA